MRQVLGSANDETAIITAAYNEGLTAQILSSVLFPSHSEIAFFGDSGHILCHDILGRASAGEIEPNDTVVPFTVRNPYPLQLEAFCSAISFNHTYPVSGDIALKVIADMESAISD